MNLQVIKTEEAFRKNPEQFLMRNKFKHEIIRRMRNRMMRRRRRRRPPERILRNF